MDLTNPLVLKRATHLLLNNLPGDYPSGRLGDSTAEGIISGVEFTAPLEFEEAEADGIIYFSASAAVSALILKSRLLLSNRI